MTMPSPFLILQDFLSIKQCEELVERFKITTPNTDSEGLAIKLQRIIRPDEGQDFFINKLYQHIGAIEEKYDAIYSGIENPYIIHYPENDKRPAEPVGCENAKFFRKKWIQTKDVQLVGHLWLKDFNDAPPYDPAFEVYGGKLELPAFNISLTPQRGTLVIFPAGPHFVTAISPVVIGDLYQIKFNISITAKNGGLWIYNPQNFPISSKGVIQDWFSDYL
jgi:hypothetical protein